MTSRRRRAAAPPPPPALGPLLESLSPSRAERLLVDLVRIYSPSFEEEELQDFAGRYLEANGVAVERQPVGDDGRCNLVAKLGEGPPGLLFIGHVDTVEQWSQGDHRARQSGTYLRGLGSADMKSGCAAMMEAFIALSKMPHPPGVPAIALALVVGEEEEGDGVEALLERMEPDLAVVGEPTNMQLCTSHYGYQEFLLSTHGRRAHSALPEIGDNAIAAMLVLLMDLTAQLSRADEARGRPALVCNLREVRGGGNAFVVPEYCEAKLDVHLPPELRIAHVRDEVRERVQRLEEGRPHHTCTARSLFGFNGYVLRENDRHIAPLLQACADVDLDPPRAAFRSHSDANCLREHGTRPIVIGPGDLKTAHTVEERVRLEELHEATRLYTAMGVRYRARKAERPPKG